MHTAFGTEFPIASSKGDEMTEQAAAPTQTPEVKAWLAEVDRLQKLLKYGGAA